MLMKKITIRTIIFVGILVIVCCFNKIVINSPFFPIFDLLLYSYTWFPAYMLELILFFLLLRFVRFYYLFVLGLILNHIISFPLFSSSYHLYSHPGTGLFDSYEFPDDMTASVSVYIYVYVILMSSLYMAKFLRKLFKLPSKY